MTWQSGLHVLFKKISDGDFVFGTASMIKSLLPKDKVSALVTLQDFGSTGKQLRIRCFILTFDYGQHSYIISFQHF